MRFQNCSGSDFGLGNMILATAVVSEPEAVVVYGPSNTLSYLPVSRLIDLSTFQNHHDVPLCSHRTDARTVQPSLRWEYFLQSSSVDVFYLTHGFIYTSLFNIGR